MKKLTILTFLVIHFCSNLNAQYFRRHEGIHFSVAGGVSYIQLADKIERSGPYEKIKIIGAVTPIDLKIGCSIMENLFIHGNVLLQYTPLISIKADGFQIPKSGNNYLIMNLIGIGSTYYIMPKNIYISATVGLASILTVLPSGLTTSQTKEGLGLYIKAGKEIMVSKNWSMGGALGINYSQVKNEISNNPEKLSGLAIGLSINATFIKKKVKW